MSHWIEKAFIRVERDKEKKFISKVKVNVKGRVIYAQKRAEDFNESLHKGQQAIMRQLEKLKRRRKYSNKHKQMMMGI